MDEGKEVTEPEKDVTMPSMILQKYLKAFQDMGVDEDGRLQEDTARKYYQMTVGEVYDEELAELLVDHMKFDENGTIDRDGVMAPFALEFWPREVLSSVCDLLENSEDLRECWKTHLSKVLELSEDETDKLCCESSRCALDYLKHQLEGASGDDGVDAKDSILMEAFAKKCYQEENTNKEVEKAIEENVEPQQSNVELNSKGALE